MRKMEDLVIEYKGYRTPSTRDEVTFEILGLELAIKSAEQRIAMLRQSLQLAAMQEKSNAETVKETPPDK